MRYDICNDKMTGRETLRMLLYLSVLDTEEEKDKFTEVYEQYRHFCWYVANQLLEDAQMAEDAVQ